MNTAVGKRKNWIRKKFEFKNNKELPFDACNLALGHSATCPGSLQEIQPELSTS